MRLHFFKRILWIVVVATTLTRLVEATAIPASACLGALCTISDTKISRAIAVEQTKSLGGREYQHLGRGRSLRYKSFFPFKPSWAVAASLCYFWTEIENQVSNTAWMPEDNFLRDTLRLHMPMYDESGPGGFDLIFEVISFDGPVSRQLASEIATTMMGYTLRGFCGFFNAWLRQAPGRRPIWIVFRLGDLKEPRPRSATAL